MMASLTPWLISIIGGLIAGIAIYLKGHSAGKQEAKAETQAKEIKAIQTAKEVNNEINGLDEHHINASLDKWMRDK